MRFTFFDDFLALVFPQTCCGCKKSLFLFEKQICKLCIAALPVTTYHLRPVNNDLMVKIMGLTQASQAISFLRFSKSGLSQRLLHQLKYKNKPDLGLELGMLYGQRLIESKMDWCWDIIVPVPLYPLKLKRRGFNQSERFASGLSASLDIPLSLALKRTKNTATQTKKSRMQRWENVNDVFTPELHDTLSGKNVLLVDDVMTTGATLAACANTLLGAGVATVSLAVIAAGR